MHKNMIDVIEQYISSAPVDVFGLADALGIKVKQESLKDSMSGSLHKNDDGEFEITINETHSENRKRFTMAHEIGHFMLHDNLIGNGIYDNIAYRSDDGQKNPNINQSHETEANRFAAGILMPEPLVREKWNKGEKSIAELAHLFGVSEQAMAIRMKYIS